MTTPANIDRAREIATEWMRDEAGLSIKMTMTRAMFGALVGRIADALDQATTRPAVISSSSSIVTPETKL